MSNFIVTGGLGGVLLATEGYGSESGAPPAGEAVLRFSTGDLLVNILYEGGKAYLEFKDGTNDVKEELPFTADQLSGNAWALIKIKRVGSNLEIYHDGSLVQTVAITHKNYGGTCTIMESNNNNLHDPRVLGKNISNEATDYYIRDLAENAGKSLLPDR